MQEITPIESAETLEKALAEPISVIFKHSTRCGISSGAKSEYDKFAREYDGDIKLYYVDIIVYRNISQEIESKTGIFHQSPQAIIMQDGEAAWNDSHWRITATALAEAIEKL